jgi:hypothetical protein
VTPYSTDDVTYEIDWRNNKYVVLFSADTAQNEPDYEEVAAFDSMTEAHIYIDKIGGWDPVVTMEERGFGTWIT